MSNVWWSTFATRFSMVIEARAAASTIEKRNVREQDLQVFIVLSSQASAEICGLEIQGGEKFFNNF